jgi:hypothetical protein
LHVLREPLRKPLYGKSGHTLLESRDLGEQIGAVRRGKFLECGLRARSFDAGLGSGFGKGSEILWIAFFFFAFEGEDRFCEVLVGVEFGRFGGIDA